jgi:predicted nucleic acid-binding protein
MMSAGVVLDTSYLITLAGPDRAHHSAARLYWRHFTEQGIPIFLPTIVVSEFCIRQQIPPEILRACVVLPFNWDDAIKAAELDFSKVDRQGESRDALKDDVKIIAQAIVKDAAWIITDDTKLFYKFACELRLAGGAAFRPIKLVGGFDSSFFDPTGQRTLSYKEEESEEQGAEGPV